MNADSSAKSSHLFLKRRSLLAGVALFATSIALLLSGGDHSQAQVQVQAAQTDTQADKAQLRQEQLAEKIGEYDALLLDKQDLEEELRMEKSALSTAGLQAANTKKLIHMEIEDFFKEATNRERLNALFEDYKLSAEKANAAALRVNALEQKLSDQHLKFSQAARDVERLKAQLASAVREQNSKRVQEIARHLTQTIDFGESISFRCSTNKSLAACLSDYQYDGRMPQWVRERYQHVLAEQLRDQLSEIRLSPSWYSFDVKSDFSEASMSLDGTITAQVNIQSTITPKKIMACAMLDVPDDLCDIQTHSLIVRSNRLDDQVIINGKSHGSTPVSLMLDSGTYDVQVSSGGATQARTLSLQGDRVVNFRF